MPAQESFTQPHRVIEAAEQHTALPSGELAPDIARITMLAVNQQLDEATEQVKDVAVGDGENEDEVRKVLAIAGTATALKGVYRYTLTKKSHIEDIVIPTFDQVRWAHLNSERAKTESKRHGQEQVETRVITETEHKAAQRGNFHQWPKDPDSGYTKTEELRTVEEKFAEITTRLSAYNAEARAVLEARPAALTVEQLQIARQALLRRRRDLGLDDTGITDRDMQLAEQRARQLENTAALEWVESNLRDLSRSFRVRERFNNVGRRVAVVPAVAALSLLHLR